MSNPRSRNSKERLKAALLELIRVKRYEEIAVAEILDHAQVSRSTFYAHFTSKEDLLFWGFDRWLLSHNDDTTAGGFRFSLPLFQHMQGASSMFRNSVKGPAGERIRLKLREVLHSVVEQELLRMRPELTGTAELPAQVRLIVGAYTGLSDWWRNESNPLSAEEVDGLFQELAKGA